VAGWGRRSKTAGHYAEVDGNPAADLPANHSNIDRLVLHVSSVRPTLLMTSIAPIYSRIGVDLAFVSVNVLPGLRVWGGINHHAMHPAAPRAGRYPRGK
jgi:hypothetical protein